MSEEKNNFRIAFFLKGFERGAQKKAYLDHEAADPDFNLGWDAGIDARVEALRSFRQKLSREKEG